MREFVISLEGHELGRVTFDLAALAASPADAAEAAPLPVRKGERRERHARRHHDVLAAVDHVGRRRRVDRGAG